MGRWQQLSAHARRRVEHELELVDLAAGASPPALEAALEEFLALEAAGWKGVLGR